MGVNLVALLTIVAVATLQSCHCKITTDTIELAEGTSEYYLNCPTTQNGTKVEAYWKKDGVSIEFGSRDSFPIFDADCSYNGNYTCFTKVSLKVVPLKRFVVKIIAKATEDNAAECGVANKDLLKEKSCLVPTINDYKCCNQRITPPGMLLLSKKLSNQVQDKCELHRMKKPWQIDVTWNLTKNAVWVWGWHVSLTGLVNYAGGKHCVKINSKDKLLNWTFDGLLFGAKYAIKVQALPSDFTNFIVKNIDLPKKKDMCKKIGRKCYWEICYPVENVQQEKMTSIITWLPSKYHKTVQYFEITYKSSDDTSCSDIGRNLSNTSRIVLSTLACQGYYVKVRPIFSNGEEGTSSKEILFTPPKPGPTETGENSYTDVIISCSIVFGLLVLGVLAVLYVKRKRKPGSAPDIENIKASAIPSKTKEATKYGVKLFQAPLIPPDSRSTSEIILNPARMLNADKTKVSIVHDNHCRLCDNVTHALANLLNKTGHVECMVDFWCTKEMAVRGMRLYEDMIKECDKFIVVCTKDGKRMRDTNEQKAGPYNFMLNMLLGRMLHQNGCNLAVFPVYFDISSHDDVPLFLSGQRSYALPSNVQNLCSALCCKNNVCNDNEMAQKINELNAAIKIMGQNHKVYGKSKFTKITSL